MSSPRPRRVLIVAYFYPPLNSIGARRPHALAKYLHRQGHEVAVVTSRHCGSGPDGAADRLVRTRDLLATNLNWRRGNFEAVTGQQGDPAAVWTPGSTLWGALFIPDVQLLSWVPFALAAAGRLRRAFEPDVVITTSPVESAHAVGWALGRRGVPWVVDMRDGWRHEAPADDYPLAFQRRLDGALERRAVRDADAVVTVSEPLAADLRARHGREVEVITNGFDPEDHPPRDSGPHQALDPGKLSLVHTGGLGGERTIAPLLEALVRMTEADPSIPDRVEIVLAGAQTEAERDVFGRPENARFVRHLGFVDRPQALSLQAGGDWLVLVTSGVRSGEATGKLFEYLATGRPLLVLGRGSAAGDIVSQERAGLVIPTHDSVAAQEALEQILAGTAAGAGHDVGRFLYPRLAERYAQVIEKAIQSRAHSSRA